MSTLQNKKYFTSINSTMNFVSIWYFNLDLTINLSWLQLEKKVPTITLKLCFFCLFDRTLWCKNQTVVFLAWQIFDTPSKKCSLLPAKSYEKAMQASKTTDPSLWTTVPIVYGLCMGACWSPISSHPLSLWFPSLPATTIWMLPKMLGWMTIKFIQWFLVSFSTG